MEIKSKNTISFPTTGTKNQRKPLGKNPKIKRTSADDVTPVTFEIIDGDFGDFQLGDFLFPGSQIAPKFRGRKLAAPTGSGSNFTVALDDGSTWNNFSTEFIDFHIATPGQIRRVSADGIVPIVLDYDDNVVLSDIAVGHYFYHTPTPATLNNLTPREIIAHDKENKRISIGDYLVTDLATHDVFFNSFPTTWTTDWEFSELVNIIQTNKSGTGTPDVYEIFYEIHGARTENIILYIDWDFADSQALEIKPDFFGYFFDEKVATWFSQRDVLNIANKNYYADTVESITLTESEFAPRTLKIDGEYRLPIPLNVPASVRFVKLSITTSGHTTSGICYLDIDENVIGKRRY